MIRNIDQFMTFLGEKKLSPNDFMILYMAHKGRIGELVELHKDISQSQGIIITIDELERLMTMGYIFFAHKRDRNHNVQKTPKGYSKPDIDSIVVTQSFREEFIVEPDEASDELFSAFPPIIEKKKPDGSKFVIKRSDGGDVDKAINYYQRFVEDDKIKHREIISRLETAKSKNLLESGFPKWVLGRMWEDPRITEEEQNNTRRSSSSENIDIA